MLMLDLDMVMILLCGVDFFICGKLEVVLLEYCFEIVDGVELLDFVIVDIVCIDVNDVVESYLDVSIFGYTNHIDIFGLCRVYFAGFDQVVVKSVFFECIRELIDGLLVLVE